MVQSRSGHSVFDAFPAPEMFDNHQGRGGEYFETARGADHQSDDAVVFVDDYCGAHSGHGLFIGEDAIGRVGFPRMVLRDVEIYHLIV